MEEIHAADLQEAANKMEDDDGSIQPQEEEPSSKRRKGGQLGFIPVSKTERGQGQVSRSRA